MTKIARTLVVAACVFMGMGGNDAVIDRAHADVAVSSRDGAPMVDIPAGPFFMGVPKWARDGGLDEYPNHEVELDAYAIDKYEVTNGLYLEFIRATGHRTPSHSTDPSKNLWQGGLMPESIASLPVVNVDWFDADAYCQWAGKRLPTEAGMGEGRARDR